MKDAGSPAMAFCKACSWVGSMCVSPTTLPNTERADEIFSSFLGCFSGLMASDSSSLIFLTLFGLVCFFSDSLFCGSACCPDREDEGGGGGGGGGGGVCSKDLVGAPLRDRAGEEVAELGNPSMPAPGGVKAENNREMPTVS